MCEIIKIKSTIKEKDKLVNFIELFIEKAKTENKQSFLFYPLDMSKDTLNLVEKELVKQNLKLPKTTINPYNDLFGIFNILNRKGVQILQDDIFTKRLDLKKEYQIFLITKNTDIIDELESITVTSMNDFYSLEIEVEKENYIFIGLDRNSKLHIITKDLEDSSKAKDYKKYLEKKFNKVKWKFTKNNTVKDKKKILDF